jgi:hypothetical protein
MITQATAVFWARNDHVLQALGLAEHYLAGDLSAVPAASDRAEEIEWCMLQASGWLSERVGCVDDESLEVAHALVVAIEHASINGVIRASEDYAEDFADAIRTTGSPGDLERRVPEWARPIEKRRVQ